MLGQIALWAKHLTVFTLNITEVPFIDKFQFTENIWPKKKKMAPITGMVTCSFRHKKYSYFYKIKW